jgi:hypothetical protein
MLHYKTVDYYFYIFVNLFGETNLVISYKQNLINEKQSFLHLKRTFSEDIKKIYINVNIFSKECVISHEQTDVLNEEGNLFVFDVNKRIILSIPRLNYEEVKNNMLFYVKPNVKNIRFIPFKRSQKIKC